MDFTEIDQAVADTVASAGLGLNTYPSPPKSITEPAFLPGGETDIDYTAQPSGFTQVDRGYRVLVSKVDDEAGQQALNAYISDGPKSVRKALEANGLLGGAVLDLMVMRVNSGRWYEYGSNTYLGAELTIRFVAPSD